MITVLPGTCTIDRQSFDPEFAAPADWAAMYRECGLQVVPCFLSSEHAQWKRPKLPDWKMLQDAIAPDEMFTRWYGPQGEHTRRPNMGLIAGAASGGVFVVDLDTHKTPSAGEWWRGVLAVDNSALEPETWQQRTGGGGRQLFFRAPAGWTPPTCKTPIGVDIRGHGGFAVMPPSLHDSGETYAWCPGGAPWEREVAEAPEWLTRAVDALVAAHGGNTARPAGEQTPSPGGDINAFGAHVDGARKIHARPHLGVGRGLAPRVPDRADQCRKRSAQG